MPIKRKNQDRNDPRVIPLMIPSWISSHENFFKSAIKQQTHESCKDRDMWRELESDDQYS